MVESLVDHPCFRQIVRFYIALDADLRVHSLSPAMQKLLPGVGYKDLLESRLRQARSVMPLRAETMDTIVGLSIILQDTVRPELNLFGAFYPLDETETPWLFVGFPKVESLAELTEWGLELQDFSASDSMSTVLMALSLKESAIRDLQAIKHRLQQVIEEKDADLAQAKLKLEQARQNNSLKN